MNGELRAPVAVPTLPLIVGIVNITQDSFSDGGLYLNPDDAVAHAHTLRASGADIIELGPASSHPDSIPVSPREEQGRLAPVLERLADGDIPLSVDSYRPQTQRLALTHGASYLNDIHGFPDPSVYDALSSASCRLVVMHAVQDDGPATRLMTNPAEVWTRINRFFDQRLAALEAGGIARERLIIDPGLGYFLGSTPEPSLLVMAGIRRLKAQFGLPVLLSPSRKSFLRTLTGRKVSDAGAASLAAELSAASNGANYIRTHDVRALHDALAVQQAILAHERPS